MPKSFAIWFNRVPGSRFSATRTTSSRNALGYRAGMVNIHACGVGAPQIVRHLYRHQSRLTFHVQDKMRTVLWGWLGEALSEEERDGVGRVLEGLDGELARGLEGLLDAEEIRALAERSARLFDAGVFPDPSGQTLATPWPLF